MLFALSVVICLLSTLVIFNTALLKDLNALIDDKNAKIEQLTEDKVNLEEVLEDVSNRN